MYRLLIMFFALTFVGLFIIPTHAHALVLLPALILIPIAKIVAVIIASVFVPAVGAGTLIGKFMKIPLSRIILMVIISLVALAVIITIGLKLLHPDRPFF